MSNLFQKNWAATKEAMLDGLTGQRRQTMNVVLENVRAKGGLLTESATAGATQAGNIATVNKVMLPLIRRIMPSVIANEILGVQPMTGPVGQIHTLRTRYADTFSGVNAGTEALSPFTIARAYSGNGVANASTSRADNAATLEGTAGKRLSVQILKATVEAKSRRLSARWTMESAQDANAIHGVDIEAEIMQALAQEITVEIDQEMINNLRNLTGAAAATYDQSAVSGTATYVGDEHAALAVMVNREANRVAERTRRGPANWAVVSPTTLTILQSATTSSFARTTEGVFEAPTNTKFVGTLNGQMKIYVDQYATTDDVLVGYKGQTETDAAAFFCPYIPLMSVGPVLDPTTLEPVVGFITRYGYLELSNAADSLGNAADFLSSVAVTTGNLKFY